jgi:hypothetical protein
MVYKLLLVSLLVDSVQLNDNFYLKKTRSLRNALPVLSKNIDG